MQAQDNTVHSINTWILKVLFLFTYITDLLKQSSSKHVGITSQSSIAHLKIPQHTSKLGESTYGKTPCVHSSSLDLRQEKGSRSSSSENQPLTMGVPGENTFVLGCMSCIKIVPFFKVHLTSVFQCTIVECSPMLQLYMHGANKIISHMYNFIQEFQCSTQQQFA